MNENQIAKEVVDAAVKVHSTLGPGLLESVYERSLAHELAKAAIPHARQVALPVICDGVELSRGYVVILEVKAVKTIFPLHEARLLTYLHLSGCRSRCRSISTRPT